MAEYITEKSLRECKTHEEPEGRGQERGAEDNVLSIRGVRSF